MGPKSKAHAAGLVTGFAGLLAAYMSGTLDQSMIDGFAQAVGLAVAAWVGVYFAPANTK